MNFLRLYAIFLINAIIATIAFAESPGDLIEKGNAAFAEKKFDKALGFYARANVGNQKSVEATFNQAVVYAKMGNVNKAVSTFEKALSLAKTPDVKAKIRYNLGNCELFSAKNDKEIKDKVEAIQKKLVPLKNAEKQFHKAVRNDPTMIDAIHNLELTRSRIRKLVQTMEKIKKERRRRRKERNDKLKDAIDKQEKLKKDTERRKKSDNNDKKDADKLAKRQERLQKRTEEIRKRIAKQKDKQAKKMNERLKAASKAQKDAAKQLRNKEFDKAKTSQKKALEELRKALEKKDSPKKDATKKTKNDVAGDNEKKKKRSGKKRDAAKKNKIPPLQKQKVDATLKEAMDVIQDEIERRKARKMNIMKQQPVQEDW